MGYLSKVKRFRLETRKDSFLGSTYRVLIIQEKVIGDIFEKSYWVDTKYIDNQDTIMDILGQSDYFESKSKKSNFYKISFFCVIVYLFFN